MRSSNFHRVGIVVGALSCAAVAHAADLPSRTAPPVFAATPVISVDDWSGVYVGTTYGYGFNTFRDRQVGVSRSRDIDGQIGGALVGYNFQYGHFVLGGEGSIDLNVIRGNIGGGGLAAAHNDSLYDIRFRGLLGYEFGQFMPFVSAGGVYNETYMSGTGGIGNVPDWYGRTKDSVGWTVGAGLDYKLFPQQLFPGLPSWLLGPVTLRGEYMYQSLPSQTYAYGTQVYRAKSDGSFLRAALIYRFGDNPPRPYADAMGDVNWAGGYGGILAGYGSPSIHAKIPGFGTRDINPDGGLGGVYAGTNFMFGRLMLGFDGSTSYQNLTGRSALPVGAGGALDSVSYRGYVNADIRGRAGYAFGNFLPFVAAGYSFSRGEIIDTATTSEKGRVPLDAFTAGGGLDYRLSQRVSLRIEDLYDFASTRKNIDINGCATCSVTRDGNTVRAGLAYHFE
jgi:outer membrane immunogenic protein